VARATAGAVAEAAGPEAAFGLAGAAGALAVVAALAGARTLDGDPRAALAPAFTAA
jgi:hypothetical protein